MFQGRAAFGSSALQQIMGAKHQDVVSSNSCGRVFLGHEYLLAFTHPTVFEKSGVIGPDIFNDCL